MKKKRINKNKHNSVISIITTLFLILLSINGCTPYIRSEGQSPSPYEIPVIERYYSDNSDKFSIGIANKINLVSLPATESIKKNKEKILDIIKIFKKYKVNMILFPEFSLTGYFWEDTPECWNYMKEGVTDKHLEWLNKVKSQLDPDLQYIIFNNIRSGPIADNPKGKFLNSTYIITEKFNPNNLYSPCNEEKFNPDNLYSPCNEEKYIYDKTFLPGIENTFTISGKTDSLTLQTQWGSFGFTTCYDMCFTQLFQEYAMFEKVDAFIQIASWRGSNQREYPGMNVHEDHYYGFIWDLMTSSQAAFNQAWVIACNAVGTQKMGNYNFWGGSGIWAPSGMKLFQGSNESEELIVIHNIDIERQIEEEHNDFSYYEDFIKVYHPIEKLRTFTRMKIPEKCMQ